MIVEDPKTLEAATQLVERHGPNAVAVAKERVDSLTQGRNQPEIDAAWRLLTAVERLVGTHASTEI